ncbi:MAG: glycine cleavage system protein [Novosphingobium sp.]|nr:glycine cleavage system protein [Novosphingobium sp.]
MTRFFTKDHEWIDVEGDSATVGITDYAQGQLGDITFVELPDVGRLVNKAESVAVVDSVKAASDVFAPVSGTVSDVNDALEGEPELVNTDADQGGWLFRLQLANADELGSLMDKAAYDAYVAGL